MAAGAFAHTAAMMAWVQVKLTGKWTDPDRLNPWKEAAAPGAARVTEASNAAGWAALGRVMTEMGKGRNKPKG